ncbi:MAG: pyridoxamine 5'-phosphate oxidase [Actinomycetota bacterium]|nr:pyridoxamine 5'-phosphate oxidase [Actinomycetota bacterium]
MSPTRPGSSSGSCKDCVIGSSVLDPAELGSDPIAAFRAWFAAAAEAGIRLPETMILATANRDGAPSARAVLLKGVDERGFTFFTNLESRKARELAENPRAALVFLWDALGRQVRVEGTVGPIAHEESEAYFRTRPRGSRIGAWASPQSAVVESRDDLERRFADAERAHPGDDVPLPPFWGGLRLAPEAIEFWQHRENRLHDRLRYQRDGPSWTVERLAP